LPQALVCGINNEKEMALGKIDKEEIILIKAK